MDIESSFSLLNEKYYFARGGRFLRYNLFLAQQYYSSPTKRAEFHFND
jgi:hypothetical protein